MCNIVWCCATSGVKCGDAMWNGVVHVECGGVLMQDVECSCGIPSDVEWFDARLDVVWCRMMVLKCSVECVMWDSVMCNLYLNVMCMVWCEVWWSDLMWIMVQCEILQFQTWCDVESVWNANVWCGIWCGVDCGVLVCGMLHNACGKLRDAKCGVELWWWRMWHMQWAVRLLCDVRRGK